MEKTGNKFFLIREFYTVMGINVSILLVTGGWNREIYWWEKYKYQFKGYINYNDTNIEIKSVGWSGNVAFCTQNMVDLSKYNKMYIKFDVYGSCGNYFNDVQVGVMSDIPVAITYNSPAVMNTYSITPEPSTENFNIIYRGDKTNKLVWNSCEYNLDILTIDRAGYIWLCPTSWSSSADYTIVKLYEIKLTQ